MTRAEATKVLRNTAWIGKEGDEEKVNQAIDILTIPNKAECENGGYISEKEKAVLDNLKDAWNGFLDLPVQHPDERIQFAIAIDACEQLIALRVARRAEPDFFATYEASCNASYEEAVNGTHRENN